MTSITKAEKKLIELQSLAIKIDSSKLALLNPAIEKMSLLLNDFISKKRKVPKEDLSGFYEWAEDEFNVMYDDFQQKIGFDKWEV